MNPENAPTNGTPDAAASALDAQTIDGLRRLAARADELEFLLDMVGGALHRGPDIADAIGRGVRDVRAARQEQGASSEGDGWGGPAAQLQVLATPEKAEQLLTALTDLSRALESEQIQGFLHADLVPSLEGLTRLAGRLEELEFLIEMISGAIARGPEIAESINAKVQEVRKSGGNSAEGIQLMELITKARTLATPETIDQAISAVQTLQSTLGSPGVQSLLESSILDPEAVEVVSELAQALIVSSREAHRAEKVGGLVALLRALRDPDINRAVGFGLEFARVFGRQLNQLSSTNAVQRRGT